MNWQIVRALIAKDFKLYFRNRFFAFITVLALVAYTVIYFVMPQTVDETLDMAVYAPVLPPILEQAGSQGLELVLMESEEQLKEAVVGGKYLAGVVIPPDFMDKLMSGEKGQLDVYFGTDTPEELQDSITVLLEEMAYLQTGQMLSVQVSPEVLGRDMVGIQIPMRDRLLPMLAVIILMMEMLGLASLISSEVVGRTVQALLVTPMTIRGLFAAKLIMGTSLAFIQVLLFMAVTGGLNQQPLIIIVALLLGAIMVTGIGFLVASGSKEMTTVMAWGFPALIVLSVPAFGVLAPGTVTDWVKAIPSYYLVDAVYRAANLNAGWSDIWSNLLVLLGVDIVSVWLGIMVLGRKLR
ncbi:MAG: ABC transporter permease [Dehalococcoidales bacterium]|nr:ABC transporter permease [Dehalococcoidales bacterium]